VAEKVLSVTEKVKSATEKITSGPDQLVTEAEKTMDKAKSVPSTKATNGSVEQCLKTSRTIEIQALTGA
jgi:hypothetical protein